MYNMILNKTKNKKKTKGSTKGRKATVKDKEVGAILKDLDFLDNGQLIQVGPIKAKLFKEQLRRDTEVDFHFLFITNQLIFFFLISRKKKRKKKKKKEKEKEKEKDKEKEVPTDNLAKDNTKSLPKEDGTLEAETKKEAADEDNEKNQYPPDDPDEYFHPSDIRTIPENEEVVDGGGGGLIADKDEVNGNASNNTNGPTSFVKVKRPKLYKKTTPSEFGLQLLSGIGSNKAANEPNNATGDANNNNAASDNRENADNGVRTIIDNSTSTTNAKTESRFESHSRNSTETNGDNTEKSIVQSLSQELGEEEMEEKELQSQNPFTSEYGGMCWEDEHGNKGNEIYFCGLIDILQKYNRRKKLEHFTVSLKHDPKTISAVPPDFYAKRMREFLEDKIV
ncbi:hypothetical protein RFI_11432 [Reticulomyxa filosa]|uniref:PIPK domain-containing protein n=1 Tax=Reticulomyxa filosa TaxID=46433 RepID=X6NI83_RETFI|nr:hypothetical protein RFI_11432 [Reticulomyxa filosa]|eukprot:ETO25706.1 hypothetical protein RFI_11432 [Reticulomyxa filosa]